MGKERVSSSDTLDRSKTKENRYVGYESGFQCADDMIRQANEYTMEVQGKGGKIMKRKLREDAVIGCAFIVNPPYEMCKNWTETDYRDFLYDSLDFLAETCPQIFRKENIRMLTEHVDEGVSENDWHYHGVVDCIDESGRYCGNLVDAKMIDTINRTYPAYMRSKGWELDDLDVTDWSRTKTDKAYKKERDSKRRQFGQSVNDYLSGKLEGKITETEQTLQDAEALKQDLEVRERTLEARERAFNGKVKDFAEKQKKWQERANTTLQEVSEQKRQLQTEIDTLRQKSTTLDSMINKLREEKTDDEIQETVLERCVYLWRDSEKKVHRLPAREYAQQMRRRREQTLQGIERELPEIRQKTGYAKDFNL